MKNTVITLVCLFLFALSTAQNNKNHSTNQLVLKFKKEVNIDYQNCLFSKKFNHKTLDSINSRYEVKKIKLTGNKKEKRTYVLQFKSEQNINQLIEIYQNTGLFDYVEPNFVGKAGGQQASIILFPNDTYFSRQWGLYNDGTFSLAPAVEDADVDMELAWEIEQGSSSIIVATLDTGLKLDHPEFSGRLWVNTGETNNGTDSDGNGYVDDILGWDFVNNDNMPTDDHGHGTNVTGIIAASGNNNLGYAGVDWNAKLMTCKILDQNSSGYYTWWADAIYYAVNNGAKVINISAGGSSYSNLLEDAVNYAYNNGVVIVVSMMNFNNNTPYYPAAYQNTIAVGSTDPNDDRSNPFFWDPASGSNFGTHIDVVAPGNYMFGLSHTSNTDYNTYWGGTSQATPIVAGICSLLLAQDYSLTPEEMRAILQNTAEDQVGNSTEDTPGFDIYFGYGRVNANDALLEVLNTPEYENINFSIFPNPAQENINIKLNKPLNQATVNLYTVLGQKILQQNANGKTLVTLELPQQPGVYLVTITNALGETISSSKIIKL